MSPETISVFFVLVAAGLLAVSQTIAKAVISRLPFYVLLLSRSVGAILLLIPVTFICGWKTLTNTPYLVLIALGGIVWPGVVNILAYRALQRLPVNVNRPIFQTYPMWAFLMSIPLALGTYSHAKLAGVLLTTAGGAGFALFNRDAADAGRRLPRSAVALVAASAVIQAAGTLVWKYAAQPSQQIPSYQMNLLQHTVSAVFFGALALKEMRRRVDAERKYSAGDVIITGFSGMLLFGIGNTLVFAALKHLDPGPAGAIYSVNILFTAAVARATLKEKWTAAQAVSALLVLVGVVFCSLK